MKKSKTDKKHRSGHKKGNAAAAQMHHPWDEVSLPGAGADTGAVAIDQPTVFKVLNDVLTDESSKTTTSVPEITYNTTETTNKCEEQEYSEEKVNKNNNGAIDLTDNNAQQATTPKHDSVLHETNAIADDDADAIAATSFESDNLVNSFSRPIETNKESFSVNNKQDSELVSETTNKLSEKLTTTVPVDSASQQNLQPAEDQVKPPRSPHVLDVEPHLIETYDEYHTLEERGVGINELAPIKDELTQGPSKVETETNVRTIIEVEPAGSKTIKPIEKELEHSQQLTTKDEVQSSTETTTAVNSTEVDQQTVGVDEDHIKKTADKLVHEIEQEVLEALRQELEKKREENPLAADNTIEEKTEAPVVEDVNTTLTQKVDEQLSEVRNILKGATTESSASSVTVAVSEAHAESNSVSKTQISVGDQLKIVELNGLPSLNSPSEKEERKLFIDSLPQIADDTDASKLAADCKRDYYKSLRKYLVQQNTDKPPVPLQTYRWEDIRRAKERGGYPWTHLYKRPLGPDEEPEIILLLRKSQEFRFASESPKSLKKVHYDEQVKVKETERYIQELSEDENTEDVDHTTTEDEESHSLHSESHSCISDSVLAVGKRHKSNRLEKLRGILKRRKSGRTTDDVQSLPGTSVTSSRRHSEDDISELPAPQRQANGAEHKSKRCFPIMKKIKSMADRQKKRLNIKKISLKKDEKIVLGEETKIMRLRSSPKSDRGEIPHFIEKQDSDDVLEIVELDESPSRKRRDDGRDELEEREVAQTSIVKPDEIIEISNGQAETSEVEPQTPEPTVSEILEEEIKSSHAEQVEAALSEAPPRKTPLLRREHVYEEIDQGEAVGEQLNELLQLASVEALKRSLTRQDHTIKNDLEATNKEIPLDRMGSSEEEQIAGASDAATSKTGTHLLAPISSIESASSDEERNRPQLSPVAEESDATSIDEQRKPSDQADSNEITNNVELIKPAIKKEASPAPSSDKKVSFSHVEDEAEPHREDIELPEEVRRATENRWKHMSDHEYEPIGDVPAPEGKPSITKEPSPAPLNAYAQNQEPMEISTSRDQLQAAEDMQKDLEERYFSSASATPRSESRTDYEIHTNQLDSSALEESPLKPENRIKGFMASAQDRTRKMQAGIRTQAGKIKTKLRTPAKKSPSSSPKAKERKRFKAPEFSKMRLPEIKRPDMSKLKDFKRPEFTKFNKPDMSKFKLPEKFSTLKLRRSKSFKENESLPDDDDMTGVVTDPRGATTGEAVPQQKKMFEFNFGTYPRAFRKKKKPIEPEPSFNTATGTEGPSVITTTGTQPSVESSSSPQGDRGPGPVRSRWADKFSDVSYNDSEGSRYRRYGSEQESFDRESSLERRMREDLEDAASEEAATNLGILGGVADQKQFAEFDEENRAIHEISNLRAGEFKRRPIVHQDSDLISEEGKEPVGWTEKEIQKNKLLRKAELEAEASYLNHPSEDGITQETQSTTSSDKKVVMEQVNDDEFFLRKRGVSEDNAELRQYISTAIREGFDMPINALQHVGRASEPMEYGDYDVPPPKPRRLHKAYRPEDMSQEFDTQRSDYGDDLSLSQNGSEFLGAPKRPMRKARSKYSMDSQDVPMSDRHHENYFDDDEDYLRPPPRMFTKSEGIEKMNNLNIVKKEVTPEVEDIPATTRPLAPRRRKRQQRDLSAEKEAYINGFGGRSVSNSYLQPPEDVIVYRTEHEYHIPLATPENYTDGASAASRKSRSLSRFDDDRTSRGADSLAMDNILKSDLDAEERQPLAEEDAQEKFIIDMMESDGYAVVRKEHIPKPTPPARRKKFSRSPGERFATMPNLRTKRGSPAPPERPPPPRGYSPATQEPVPPLRKSALSLDQPQNIEDDYEEPEPIDNERPESPRNLQSGEIINKMKYRPLPPPPRPPREKKQRGASGKGFMQEDGQSELESNFDDRDGGVEGVASSTADSYDHNGDFDDDQRFVEVEVSTQTDPLPDDFVCEEFEITDDMKVIEPRRSGKTLEDLLQEEQDEIVRNRSLTEDEQLAKGLQKFRDANQRSLSEKSRASSQADRSKSRSDSRPQTPSAVIIERRVSTPIPNRDTKESVLEAALIVRPIDDLDLEEEELRREGLLTDSSQQSKSDVEEEQVLASDYSRGPSSIELEEAIISLRAQTESERETEDDKEVELTMQEHPFEYYKHEETHLTLGHRDEESDEEEKRETIRMIDVEYNRERTPSANYDEEYLDYLKEKISKFADSLSKEKEQDLYEEDAQENVTELEISQVSEQYQESLPQTLEDLPLSDSEPIEKPTQQLIAPQESEPPPKLTESSLQLEKTEPESTQPTEQPEPPQAPPRRRTSTTFIEPVSLAIVEQEPIQEIVPQQSLTEQPTLPTHMAIADLEVDRLRVHALQAGQIMVSQLHGTQISSDELECKSGNLVVKNIELPPGFIEDIVERVRISERGQVQAAETQTSPKTSQELLAKETTPPTVRELVPPPKPPRQKDLEAGVSTTGSMSDALTQRKRNFDEETTSQSTQTLETTTSSPLPATAFPTVEYLQSLAPLAFYNLRNIEQDELHHRRRRHHHHRRSRESSPSEQDEEQAEDLTEEKEENAVEEKQVDRRRRRTRSVTRPSSEPQQSVAQAGRQFLSACSLSLVHIINQLTDSVRNVANKEIDPATRSRQVPTLVVLFILITFGILLFLLSGKSVHHHHWDYFNPPGNDGRSS